uniref:Uncharacterized protein n=1 Tax=Anguilla anguilla TaxID=7936 RepID=A0A0E9QKB3_ANGAN
MVTDGTWKRTQITAHLHALALPNIICPLTLQHIVMDGEVRRRFKGEGEEISRNHAKVRPLQSHQSSTVRAPEGSKSN